MKNIKKGLLELLRSYPEKKRVIEQLKFELRHPAQIGEDELIDSLSARPLSEGRMGGGVSNKTMTIALQYQNTLHHMNSEAVADIARDLRLLESEIARLEHYVSLLEELKGTVIRQIFFERRSLSELENECRYSKSTIYRVRNEAIDDLVSMYIYLDDIKSKSSDKQNGQPIHTE